MEVSIVGDVMPGGILCSCPQKYKDRFLSDDVRGLLKADVVICNLECPLTKSGRPPYADKALLHATANAVELLKYAGFSAVSLANNHIMDFGYESLLDTMNLPKEKGIACTGAGKNLSKARSPVFFEKDRLKVALLAYAAPETWAAGIRRGDRVYLGWLAAADKAGVAPFDLNLVQEDLGAASKEADFVIVYVHWGDVHTRFPDPELLADAHRIVDMGARLIVGSHSHVLQGYERHRHGLIVYSLGNFLFSPYYDAVVGRLKNWSHEARESVILRCKISRSGVSSYELIPVVQRKWEPVVTMAPPRAARRILSRIESLSREYRRTDYDSIYTKQKQREERLKYVRLALQLYEEYGLSFTLKLAGRKLWEAVKNLARLRRHP